MPDRDGFREHSMVTSASTAATASASVAVSVASAPTARAILSGYSCMSTAVIFPAPARFSTATTSAPMGPAPMTRTDRSFTSPARATACHATLAGSASEARRRSRPSGRTRSMRVGTATWLTNNPSACGKCAALPRYVHPGEILGRSAGYFALSPPGVAGWMVTGVPAPGPLPSVAPIRTVPDASCPSRIGARRIDSPAAPCCQ